mmetsp:Transcript_24265/g.56231  ORF Transcript_24265/g.56231 Transcript_24265/m.56231 type:complete len:758 (-) Transcript_24265:19-2292(-)
MGRVGTQATVQVRKGRRMELCVVTRSPIPESLRYSPLEQAPDAASSSVAPTAAVETAPTATVEAAPAAKVDKPVPKWATVYERHEKEVAATAAAVKAAEQAAAAAAAARALEEEAVVSRSADTAPPKYASVYERHAANFTGPHTASTSPPGSSARPSQATSQTSQTRPQPQQARTRWRESEKKSDLFSSVFSFFSSPSPRPAPQRPAPQSRSATSSSDARAPPDRGAGAGGPTAPAPKPATTRRPRMDLGPDIPSARLRNERSRKKELFWEPEDFWLREADGSSTQALRISHVGGVMGEKVRLGANALNDLMLTRARTTASTLVPGQTLTLSESQRRALTGAKTISGGVVFVSNVVASGIETVGKTVGSAVGAVAEMVPPSSDKRVGTAGEMAGAAVGALANTAFALRDAALLLLGGAKEAAVTVTGARYGEEAAMAVDQGVGVVYDLGSAAYHTAEIATADTIMEGVVKGVAIETTLEAGTRLGRTREFQRGGVLRHGRIRLAEVAGVSSSYYGVLRLKALLFYSSRLPVLGVDVSDPQEAEESGRVVTASSAELDHLQSNGGSANELGDSGSETTGAAGEQDWVLVGVKDEPPGGVAEAAPTVLKYQRTQRDGEGRALAREERVVTVAAPDRIIPLESITRLHGGGNNGLSFDIVTRERGDRRPYTLTLDTAMECSAWLAATAKAAAEERQRLTAFNHSVAAPGTLSPSQIRGLEAGAAVPTASSSTAPPVDTNLTPGARLRVGVTRYGQAVVFC